MENSVWKLDLYNIEQYKKSSRFPFNSPAILFSRERITWRTRGQEWRILSLFFFSSIVFYSLAIALYH